MRLNKTHPSPAAVVQAELPAAEAAGAQPRVRARARHRTNAAPAAGSAGMSEAMRTILWITGVAFGVAAPGAFAQTSVNAETRQESPAFLKLDSNHDGYVSREEAKRNKAVSATFDQADMNHDGRLDEDELIKALSMRQRENVEKLADDGESAARRYAVDSEITARVKAALLRTEGLHALEISVQTYKGRVQLAGFADSKTQIAQAGKVAAQEPGVKAVLNDLTTK